MCPRQIVYIYAFNRGFYRAKGHGFDPIEHTWATDKIKIKDIKNKDIIMLKLLNEYTCTSWM